jgi:hypothetical protein
MRLEGNITKTSLALIMNAALSVRRRFMKCAGKRFVDSITFGGNLYDES